MLLKAEVDCILSLCPYCSVPYLVTILNLALIYCHIPLNVYIIVGVRKPLSANALHTCGWQAAGRGLGRGKTVACAACSAQDQPPSQRFRLLDGLEI